MSRLVIKGGKHLEGEVYIHGAKNSSLPVLAATILCGDICEIHNCPYLTDVDASLKILNYLGCTALRENDKIHVDSKILIHSDIPDKLMHEMRSSIIFLGAVLARTGRARLSFPGGCDLGSRPIDIHLKALRQMGASIEVEKGIIDCRTEGRLKGAHLQLTFPSVGATENIMIAAATARGETIISNAAREPEICDLAAFLNACGAKISGHGGGVITIEGVETLHGCSHTIIPDRIIAATYLAAAAVTGGKIKLNGIVTDHLTPILAAFEESGCLIEEEAEGSITITAPKVLKPMKDIRTMPYPGFPTDAQAILMSVAAVAEGTSVFVENIFDNRYKHVGELRRLGANINLEGKVAVVEGIKRFSGADVQSTDLRGAAALVIAGLNASGETRITRLRHLDRGYDGLVESLNLLGADITRM
ncbi:MAG: UDP-N-acetylglucosamine 1-carboxyvinyltransferase [Oscillospiraceae bacterium]|jgi:UDP-N-acetylglucosamine 1-carboxyvinyltransferase|nr:UDP-N-acetylglucosamine 1-carboxyvinyltransferase [Oscillospiraceae bacterium]